MELVLLTAHSQDQDDTARWDQYGPKGDSEDRAAYRGASTADGTSLRIIGRSAVHCGARTGHGDSLQDGLLNKLQTLYEKAPDNPCWP